MLLNEGQEEVLTKLVERLDGKRDRLPNPAERVVWPYGCAPSGDVEIGNVLGLLGPRGAGKSTLLNVLFERHGDDATRSQLVFSAPLDCSLVPVEVAPGSALLLCLEKRVEEAERTVGERRDAVAGEIRDLAALYAQSSERYRTLRMELAASPSAYTRALLDDARQRLALRQRLEAWLERALHLLSAKAFVVLLDDFDLVPADQVRRWMLSLLDELQQRRLLVVLTADYYRLEHLSWDPKVEVDDKTGRALLAKLLPPQNRIHLSRWPRPSRESFRLPEEEGDEHAALGARVMRYSVGLPAQGLLLRRLLPRWPRGLRNLFLTLLEEERDRGPEPERGSSAGDGPNRLETSRFLAVLASCRGEPILARNLAAGPLASWVRRLRFAEEELSEESWQETVEAASQRAQPDHTSADTLRPLEALNPHTAWARGQASRQGTVRSLEAMSDDYAALLGEVPERLHPLEEESAERDPLRHGYLRVLPLGDAESTARPFWAEALINYGLHACDDETEEEATHSTVAFLSSWTPIAVRLKRTAFDVSGSRSQLRGFLSMPSVQRHRAALVWFAWEADGEGGPERARIGWQPYLDALRGARDLLPSRLLDDLGTIDPGSFSGEVPAFGSKAELAVLPREVWALVMLAEGLRRCPWEAFSGSRARGWEVTTHLALAAAFVRSAYVYALVRSGQLNTTELHGRRRRFFDLLDRRDPGALLAADEENVLEQAAEVLLAPLAPGLTNERDPLVRATKAFLGSTAYGAVVDLVASSQSPPATAAGPRRSRRR